MIRIPKSLFPLLTAPLLAGCFSYDDSYFVGQATYQLAEIKSPDGPSEVYELRVVSTGAAFLNVIREGEEAHSEVGLRLVELDKVRAEKCGVRPYSGLLVRTVERESPAESSDIKPGDVLLSINGTDVFYLKNYNETLDGLAAGEPADFKIKSPGHGGEAHSIKVSPETRMRKTRDFSRIPLETPTVKTDKPYAGLSLRAVPANYVKKIYGDDRNVVVVSGVALGSPAYHAGMRAGDIIEHVDGQPTPELDDLLRTIRERGPRGDTMAFEVGRGNGKSYTAKVELDDYSGTTRAYIPLVFGAHSNARYTNWDVLLGGWLADYNNAYTNSPTRESQERGSFSMVLGLFKYSWGPKGASTRLLWFIKIG